MGSEQKKGGAIPSPCLKINMRMTRSHLSLRMDITSKTEWLKKKKSPEWWLWEKITSEQGTWNITGENKKRISTNHPLMIPNMFGTEQKDMVSCETWTDTVIKREQIEIKR